MVVPAVGILRRRQSGASGCVEADNCGVGRRRRVWRRWKHRSEQEQEWTLRGCVVAGTRSRARGWELGAAEEKLCGSARPMEAPLTTRYRAAPRPQLQSRAVVTRRPGLCLGPRRQTNQKQASKTHHQQCFFHCFLLSAEDRTLSFSSHRKQALDIRTGCLAPRSLPFLAVD